MIQYMLRDPQGQLGYQSLVLGSSGKLKACQTCTAGDGLFNGFLLSISGFPHFPFLLQRCVIGVGRRYQYVFLLGGISIDFFPLCQRTVAMRQVVGKGILWCGEGDVVVDLR